MAYTTIKKPSDYFNTKLYTGNGGTNAITGVGFQPDFTWIKARSAARDHNLYDSVRGATKWLDSHQTVAEATQSNGLTSFDLDGFSVGNLIKSNNNSETYASWNWLADNTSGSSNTDGSITSTVSANTTSGFSIVSWTGDGTSTATIGHSLGVTPSMIILKNRTDEANWVVKHKSLSSGYNLFLNSTSAEYNTTSQGHLADLSSSSTFGFVAGSSGNNQSNGSGDNMIAYCFADVKGFSKFGSYIGNGTSGVDGAGDGTFVYTGFKPGMIIIKPSSAVENWQILDNKRPGFNESDNLAPNNNAAENTSNNFVDLVSNGFKLRSGSYSASGVTYIYMAFAEEPLVGDNPATAR